MQGVAGWTLQYEGVTDPLSQRESVYLEFFFEAISGPVEVRQLDRPEVLGNFRNRPEVLEALAQAAECACGSGAHYTLCPMGSKECGWAPSRPLLMKSQKRAKYWPW
ncbi:hypothetical protein HYW32_01650 [Candidatus Berkelbacteria bacterium]|nr:hypothetical protein [Candidatus Berkelbacteria bacterium]